MIKPLKINGTAFFDNAAKENNAQNYNEYGHIETKKSGEENQKRLFEEEDEIIMRDDE